MKTLICQLNTTPNDFKGNVSRIVDGINRGRKDELDLIVFPELTIPGYLCKDMMFRKGFVDQNLDCLRDVANFCVGSKSLTVVLGYIDRNYTGVGKPFRNMAAVIKDGRVVATYQKRLLPFYDVFDEGRYFQPGTELTVVDICGEKWGICICEDVWNDKGSDDYNYQFNPLEEYRRHGIYNVISINSSPYVRGKPEKRMDMLAKSVEDVGQIIYCNQTGGQDELVFDGNSMIVTHHGLKNYKRDGNYLLFDNTWGAPPPELPRDNVYEMLKLGLRDYINKSKFKSVVVGSSGGIDSATAISLACDAIGPKNVHGIRMPSTISSGHSKDDAKQLHDNLGCNDYLVPIDHNLFIGQILGHLGKSDNLPEGNPLANENIQARMRGLVLMYFSNAFGSMLLSTGNKTELALGYCTLYGDMNGGFCPISDLYKMEVYAMAKYFNDNVNKAIPQNILTKAPSAELAPGQIDEEALLPYPILDAIVKGYVENFIGDFKTFKDGYASSQLIGDHLKVKEWMESSDAEVQYNRMLRLINNNEFKRRQAAPGIKVSKVAFGIGRRLPIAKG